MPKKKKNKSRDREYWSHSSKPRFLQKIAHQSWDCCWSIPPIRQLDGLFREAKLLAPDESLSIQELLDLMPRTALDNTGRLKPRNYKDVIKILTTVGTVLERDNPFTQNFAKESKVPSDRVKRFRAEKINFYKYHKFDDDEFDRLLERSVRQTPTTANLIITAAYGRIRGKGVYNPGNAKQLASHTVLIIGFGVDRFGRRFWECQDSYGREKGDKGIIRVGRGENLITDFYEFEGIKDDSENLV